MNRPLDTPPPRRRTALPSSVRALLPRAGVLLWTILILLTVPAPGEDRPGDDSAGATPEPASTQPAPAPAAEPPELTAQDIPQRLQAVQDRGDLPEDVRSRAVELLTEALADLRAAEEDRVRASAYEQAVESAPREAEQLRRAATQPGATAPDEIPPDLGVGEMESRLRQLELELAARRQEQAELAERQAARPARQAEIESELADAQARLDAVAQRDEPETLRQVRRTRLRARRQALRAEAERLRKEQASFEPRGMLLRARRDALARRIARDEARIQAWRQAVAAAREESARRKLAEARQAEREAADEHPLVQAVTRKTSELAAERTGPDGLNPRLRQVRERLGGVREQLAEVETARENIRQLVERIGLTQSIGMLLRRYDAELPNVQAIARRRQKRQKEIARLQMRLFELDERRADLTDPLQRARRLVAQAEPPVPHARREDVIASVAAALQAQREVVSGLLADYDQYFKDLVELDTAESRLADESQAFSQYIAERVLWIQSTPALAPADAGRTLQGLLWLGTPAHWLDAGRALTTDLLFEPLWYLLAVGVLVILILARRRLDDTPADDTPPGAKVPMERFLPTVRALAGVLAVSAIAPGVAAFLAWRLREATDATAFTNAVGGGLLLAAAVWYPVAVLRRVCRPGGLGEIYFLWPAEQTRALARSLRTPTGIGLILVFLATVARGPGLPLSAASLGRVALIAVLVLLAVYLAWLLRPGGMVVSDILSRRAGWVHRTRHAWYAVLVVGPAALALAAGLGYFYTAVELASRLILQFWLLLGLLLFYAVLMRWRMIARRKLALQTIEKRRHAEAKKKEIGEVRDLPGDARVEPVDLSTVSAQTRQLVRYLLAALLAAGLWWIWADVLPALAILEHVELWHVSVGEIETAVTLADLALALILAFLTVAAARNLPGMLELTVLQRLHMDPGGRNAVTTLARYAITAVGVVLFFQLLGVSWSHVQWLLAAMTVGLGFGLQEIFANFVSGLILLIERPIRVGDVVTVGDVSGTVMKIRIRATTITDWDRKELIVPNREFITGQLVNWSLSDNILRVVVKVGIAYGSDVALAKKLMLQAARDNERVVDDPEPYVLFVGFGDSSLNFEVRAYVGGLKDYLATIDELHDAIDRAFRENGVTIPFPQRDVYIKAQPPALPRSEGPADGEL